jgi:hypothetical protein
METKTNLEKYIVNVQGKDFITFPGLLAEAHAQGLTSITTELVNTDLKNPVVKATVILVQDKVTKTFTGYGDANEFNVAKMVAKALIRMAETRSVSRALRFACNIDMTALEELDVTSNEDKHEPTTKSFSPQASFKKSFTPTTKTDAQMVQSSNGQTTSSVVTVSEPTSAVTINSTPVSNGSALPKPTFAKRVKATTVTT